MSEPSSENISDAETAAHRWTFLSNHAHVLLCIVRDPDARVRDIAAKVGITQRAVQRILSELEEVEILTRERHGRRNRYLVNVCQPLRHPLERHCTIGQLMSALGGTMEELSE